MIWEVEISETFSLFMSICFGKEYRDHLSVQHDQYDFGKFALLVFLEAYNKFRSPDWVFSYNCSDCSFPKFKNIITGKTEPCPECGD